MKMNMMTETTFSHDSDLEEAVIGACMIERAAMPLVVDKLRPEMFYEEKNLEIFAALQSMYRSAKSIDTITLKNELAARGKLDAVGGPYELLRISSKVSSSAHLEYHALILRQLHTRRIMRTGFQQLLAFSADESMDIDDILVEAHRLLEGLEDESGVADHLRSIDRLMVDTPRLRRCGTWDDSDTRLHVGLVVRAGWCIGVILRIGNRVASRNEQGARLWIFSRLRVNNGLLYGQGCRLGKLKRHRRGHSRWRAGCEYIGS